MSKTRMSDERGAALIVALVFLGMITLISITAMRTSTMELRQASNEQALRTGVDAVQSAVDAVINSNAIRVTNIGTVTCFGFGVAPTSGIDGTVCNVTETMVDGAGRSEANLVQITLQGEGTCPPSVASSARGSSSLRTDGTSGGGGGTCAYITLDSLYDASAQRGGRVQTQEGLIRLMF